VTHCFDSHLMHNPADSAWPPGNREVKLKSQTQFGRFNYPVTRTWPKCQASQGKSPKWPPKMPAKSAAKNISDDSQHLVAARVTIYVDIWLVFAQPSLIFVYLAPIWLLHWQIYDQGVAAKQRRMANCGVAKSNGKCIIKRRVCQMISAGK